jgi:hypothetical protein
VRQRGPADLAWDNAEGFCSPSFQLKAEGILELSNVETVVVAFCIDIAFNDRIVESVPIPPLR